MTVAYPQRLEAGPWFDAGDRLEGEEVRRRLWELRPRPDTGRPYCVYVHVPFCASICPFCALYTRAIPSKGEHLLDEYLERVLQSIDSHPWAKTGRPPTTVHFGGGTPLFLGLDRLGTLVRGLAEAFGTSPSCEWALETTTSSIDEATLDTLATLGFSRIHLGIQTLDDRTRERIGRRETGSKAIERIRIIEERGFLSSVDLVIGFDGVGASTVSQDLTRIHEAGVRMFSICELRERGTPRLGIQDPADKLQQNYRLWRTIWDFMAEKRLPPIHLGQFGRAQADNLYFTHPARGEDCAAIGPYSHGSAQDLYYGNRLMPDYYVAISEGRTPIGHGVEYRHDERVIRDLERGLLAHRLEGAVVDRILEVFPGDFPRILGAWLADGLLSESADGSFAHTVDGSWFVGNMIAESRGLVVQSSRRSA